MPINRSKLNRLLVMQYIYYVQLSLHYQCTNNNKAMSYNPYAFARLKRKLVERSCAPRYKGNFALTTNVTLLSQFSDFVATMERAAESMSDPFYLHFKIETSTPADTVRIVPTILQSFNRTRTLRRARVSGLRMCNMFTVSGDWYYVSDMVVSCSFDALAISTALAEYSHVGSFIIARYELPLRFRRLGPQGINKYAAYVTERFWCKSKLARHSVSVHFDSHRSNMESIYIEFEPKELAPISLLTYILNGSAEGFASVEVGRNSRLVISRKPMITREDYLVYSPDKQLNNYRYRHFCGFGMFYNNPDFPIY